MVRQQYAESVMLLVIPLLFALLLAVYWKMADKFIEDDCVREVCVTAIPLIATVALGIALAICIPLGIARIINPEYYAMADILQMISGGN